MDIKEYLEKVKNDPEISYDKFKESLKDKKTAVKTQLAFGLVSIPAAPIALGAGILKAGLEGIFSLAGFAVIMSTFPSAFISEISTRTAEKTNNKLAKGLLTATSALFKIPTLGLNIIAAALAFIGKGLLLIPNFAYTLASAPILISAMAGGGKLSYLAQNYLDNNSKTSFLTEIFEKVKENIAVVEKSKDALLDKINLAVEDDNENNKTYINATFFINDDKLNPESIKFIYNGVSNLGNLTVNNSQKLKNIKSYDRKDIYNLKEFISHTPEKVEISYGDETTEMDFPQNIVDSDINKFNMLY